MIRGQRIRYDLQTVRDGRIITVSGRPEDLFRDHHPDTTAFLAWEIFRTSRAFDSFMRADLSGSAYSYANLHIDMRTGQGIFDLSDSLPVPVRHDFLQRMRSISMSEMAISLDRGHGYRHGIADDLAFNWPGHWYAAQAMWRGIDGARVIF